MVHQSGRKKLNRNSAHRRALIRNQAIHLITYGHLVTTKPRVKEVQRFVEKMVTAARDGNTFNARRYVMAALPYKKEAVIKLFKEIAPRYVTRPGGYTRVIPMGRRTSDTAPVSRLEWVQD
jgi:large subunit ribosomal protein L17